MSVGPISGLPLRADVIALVAQVSSGPEADDETERLGIPKADDKLELLR